jgi:photosystem II stability/assembly factor-like uncharacterized protein
MSRRSVAVLLMLAVVAFLCCTNKRPAKEFERAALSQISNSLSSGSANIYLSPDAGLNWQPFAQGVPSAATVSVFHVIGNKIYAATDSHGIYLLKSGASTWQRIDTGLPKNVDINALTSIEDILVIGTSMHGIWISQSNGEIWHQPSRLSFPAPIRTLIVHDRTLLAGTDNGILKSSDHGKTWRQVFAQRQVNGFSEMNNKIYAAVVDGAIMTPDNGDSWQYIYRPHTLHDISNDGRHVYAMTLGGGLLRSEDDGLSWEKINNGLGTLNFYTFEIRNSGDDLFAAQWHGIYRSEKDRIAWNLITGQLPDSTAFTTLEAVGSTIIAGTGLQKH